MPAIMPNPFFESAPSGLFGADAVASAQSPAPVIDAAAPQSSMATEEIREAPAAKASNPGPAGVTDLFGSDISDVGEIFYHAKLLVAEDNATHRRFVLDQRAFEQALEEPPLFLRRAG